MHFASAAPITWTNIPDSVTKKSIYALVKWSESMLGCQQTDLYCNWNKHTLFLSNYLQASPMPAPFHNLWVTFAYGLVLRAVQNLLISHHVLCEARFLVGLQEIYPLQLTIRPGSTVNHQIQVFRKENHI